MSQKRHSPETESTRKRTKLSEASHSIGESSAIHNRKLEEAEVGIIESVSVKNFMCHSHLDFKFGPHVNFIIGRNGSGKSAILTAVVAGLGGKANVTGRAANLRGFIKNGKQIAETAVRIRNCGPDAYKPEEYGSVIIVERRLTTDGSSSYKLKSESGSVISTKREELVHILDQFNIQVDNPVSVLNQDTSRSFLNFKSSKDKYMFFLKATQLEQIMHDYTRTDETAKIIRDILQRKKETLPELEKEVKEWRQKWEFHQSLEKQRTKLEHLQNEFAWAYVAEKEKMLDEKFQKVEEQKRYTPKFTAKVNESQEKLEKTVAEKQEIQTKLQTINIEIKAIQGKHIEAKHQIGIKKKVLRNKELELRKVLNEMSSLKKDTESLKRKIDELKMGGQQDHAAERQKRLENIERLEMKKAEFISEQQTIEFNHKRLEAVINKTNEEIYSLRQEFRNVRQQIDALQHSITNLENSRSNELRRFGHYIPELLDRIEQCYRQKRFIQKPHGPIGACIKLHEAKWALAVETCLKSLVFAFCCDNHQDERVLQNIMRSVVGEGRKPCIIVSKFRDEVYDVRKHAVQSNIYHSVLDMLDITDHVIANCLIDQRSVESILLIEDNKEARNVMIDGVPHNCREAFTIVGDHLYPSPTFRYYSNTKKVADFLQGSVEDKIKEKKEEIQNFHIRYQSLQEEISKLNQVLHGKQTEDNKIMNNVARIRQSIAHLNVEITELKNIEEPELIDVTVFEVDLNEMQSQLKSVEQQEGKLRQEYEDAKKEVNEIEEEYHKKDDSLKAYFSNIEPLKDGLGNIESEIEQIKSHKQHYERKLKEHEKKVSELNKEYEITKVTVEAYIAKANKISPRIKTKRTYSSIENEIDQIQKQLRHEDNRYGNKDEVTERYYETQKKYDQIKCDVKVIENFTNNLNNIMEERKSAYNNFRKQLSMRVKYLFIISLSQRNYSGKIDFNHKKGTLDVKVQPNCNEHELNEDMKVLSGGERSFTTVCLILALWDAIESPFRILDEFDVFMDMVNRRISMDMMLDTAHRKSKHQFIFLTPLDMTNLRSSQSIQICRMPDPDRSQKSLTLTKSQEESEEKKAKRK